MGLDRVFYLIKMITPQLKHITLFYLISARGIINRSVEN